MTTALCCRLAGVDDELLLTMLTMAMTLIVCMKKNLSIEFTASMIIVGNILGYLLGTLGANLMGLAISSPYLIQPLSTFITTEILGWSIVAIAGIFKLGKSEAKKESFLSPYMKWLLFAAGSIFMMRIVVAFIFSQLDLDQESIYNTIKDKVLERSLYLYNNKHCHTCAQCLSLGVSSYKCPKYHHLNVYE